CFSHDPPASQSYPLSLHDALPISYCGQNKDKVIDSRETDGAASIRRRRQCLHCGKRFTTYEHVESTTRLSVIKKDGSRVPYDRQDRKSTRLNSSHAKISYAVFCLK